MSSNSRAQSSSPGAEEDPDLALAIALSLQEQEDIGIECVKTATVPERHVEKTTKPAPVTNFGALILDRKKMEEERLARLKKRSATQAELDDDQSRRPKIQRPEAPSKRSTSDASPGLPRKAPTAGDSPSLPFPNGVFKRTWALGYPRNGEDIKIEEVLQKDKLQLAVLSSFQWDEEWLLGKVDARQTKMLLIAYANNEAEKATIRANAPTGLVRFCFPPMHGGYMHSKLQILKYEGYLRIVIPSGNLVPYDWGETGVLENMVFLIDLPRIGGTHQTAPPAGTAFGTELRRFLRALGLDEKLVKSLDNYDFSKTSRYGFVHSIAGSHANDSWQHTGYCGLGSTVRSLGLATEEPVNIDYVASSLGSLTHDYLTAIYHACQGDSGMKEYEARQSKPTRNKAAKAGLAGSRPLGEGTLQWQHHFRIYFPTEKTVSSSRGGRSSAGTICFQEKWWKSSTFPRELLRDCQSVRSGLLLHSKSIFVRGRAGGDAAWAYVGSANLSESAWGRLVKDRESGAAKLTCRNWECGVLVAVEGNPTGTADSGTRPGVDQDAHSRRHPWARVQAQTLEGYARDEETSTSRGVAAATAADSEENRRQQQLDRDESAGLDEVFGTTVPIPMKVPAGRYMSDESAASRPWFFMKAD
ncbi:ubiquitin interaction domain-containing protein [Colletotrichum higginsianum]|uniref:Ubiquitin interaction domain-containing protein n=1 Tax=Colletotrichum higginsianum (strain IMI 349063) TaxID=759273 RepID=H1UXI8_COLHI|nr:ubiquitin interaction domain-containing protein [Colletotrichum higginsianum]